MQDTSPEMLQKQIEIIQKMTPQQRWAEGFDMIDFCYSIVKQSLQDENNGIGEADLRIAIFRRYYSNEFSKEMSEKIEKALRNFVKN